MHHSSVAVQPDLTHSPCWVIKSVVFLEVLSQRPRQSRNINLSQFSYMGHAKLDASWGRPICGSQVQEQPCALFSLKINIPISLRMPGLRCFGIKVERAAHRSASVCQWGELLSQGKELYPICWFCLSLRNGQRGKSCYPVKYLQEQQTKQL